MTRACRTGLVPKIFIPGTDTSTVPVPWLFPVLRGKQKL